MASDKAAACAALTAMVINVIIKKIMETLLFFRNEMIYVTARFYADDGMLMATSVRENGDWRG